MSGIIMYPSVPSCYKAIKLKSGSGVVIAVTIGGNLFTVEDADMRFVLGLVAQLEAYVEDHADHNPPIPLSDAEG